MNKLPSNDRLKFVITSSTTSKIYDFSDILEFLSKENNKDYQCRFVSHSWNPGRYMMHSKGMIVCISNEVF